ncbi:hypothetical protein [Deinococcus peraridilitoris]|uniref:Uncharacterized protein n=1 Tax=Deinococcus peraridilitoris (strain DSM 19664 / LMG 22246 / CIP 109416 / KR-200) TaxID=937777 RepID=L0A3G1_DEIPD|nr:hypothetical protein [Deinococcus peraridilitoris]AFZ67545.1 hypothetical protein Deipe_2049 [Deinococcus peraridilitoris DSM 19664]
MTTLARSFKRAAGVGLLPVLLALIGLVALAGAVSFLIAWSVGGEVRDAVWFFSLMTVALMFGWGVDQLMDGAA